METQLSYWVENIVVKGEQAISPFPMFSKAVYCACVKMSIYGVKGKQQILDSSKLKVQMTTSLLTKCQNFRLVQI